MTKSSKVYKFVKKLLILFIVFNASYFIINDLSSPDIEFGDLTDFKIEEINNNECSLSIVDIVTKTLSSSQKREIILYQRNLNIFPETSNLRCLGMVTDISVDYSNRIFVFIGTSNILFLITEIIFLILLTYNLILSKDLKNIRFNFLIYVLGYVSMYFLFVSELNIFRIFFPMDYNINNLSGYFFNVVYLSIFSNKIQSKLLLTFYFYFFLFLFNEYFGIYIVVFFLFNIFSKNFKYSELKHLNISVFIFYFLRIFSGIFSPFFNLGYEFNNLWSRPTQRIFSGSGRYTDMYWNFASFRNIYNIKNNIPCINDNCDYLLNGGPISRSISFNSNPHQAAIVIGTISIFLLLAVYLRIINNNKNNSLLLLILFLSPPMNNLTFLGNDDLLIGLLIYFTLSSKKLNYFIKNLLIYPLALFQIYPGVFYFSLLYLDLLKRKLKKAFIPSIFLISFLLTTYYFFFIEDPDILFTFNTTQIGYGFRDVSVNFSKIFNISSSLIYFSLLFTLISFPFIYRNKLTSKFLGSSDQIFNDEILSHSLLFFLAIMLFAGTVYSLPLHFYFLYHLFNISKNRYLKFSIILFIFFTPSIINIIPDFIRLILDTTHDLAGLFIFVVSASVAFDNFFRVLKSSYSKDFIN